MAKRKMAKDEALKLAKAYGIKFTGDFHADCSMSEGGYLSDLAKVVGYRKPKNATGSTGRYFYYHLYKLFGKNLSGLGKITVHTVKIQGRDGKTRTEYQVKDKYGKFHAFYAKKTCEYFIRTHPNDF